ncbi:hypothetical protein GOODEAATRI_028117 [Goodea atripinnis]|uniref:Uncharacterized protein n=1 Tax=Goodea atripinnis TaxID=208336 RepID=A0ABV0Q1P8_9TELE
MQNVYNCTASPARSPQIRFLHYALFPVHLVDIWNVIEAFRENGLNTMDLNAELAVARLEVVLSTLFYQLNKRMPTTHQISVEQSVSLLLNFLLAAYNPEGHGKISVFVAKMALASICGGKILDKLRCKKINVLISDSAGIMVHSQFDQFLREVLKLPMAVFEGPSFGYTEQAARACFTQQKSPAKKLSHVLSKSLSCASSREPLHPMFPDMPEKPLNLAHVV